MNSVVGEVVFDACCLSNFASVDRLDLLASVYGYRARWTATVREEIRRGVRMAPYLQRVLDADWLGEPIDIEGTPSDLAQIDRLRRGLGGGRHDQLKHLGEAEIIFYVEHLSPSSVFATDDQPASDFARRRQLHVIDSVHILSECHSYGEIGCPDAYTLLAKMAEAGRGVRIPPNHTHVC